MTQSETSVDRQQAAPARGGMRVVSVNTAQAIRNGEVDDAARPGRRVRGRDPRAGERTLERRFALISARTMTITWLTIPRRPKVAAGAARA
jgi:hypothetical protein